ncbi:hypothetical protein D7V97_25135 [Corallococcus sp. CA053C]|uniref:hypothetical protein n=1 Tax=Corallococcus sp. CA053C TaxID=2316732 RepID=UPI000EA2E86F|nr:hypothetical protein [Corallococcus sp. CA053C]RKH04606.1 hypothetical protein D7V97_25135 [Corallococcus sp. CA053C]
MNAFRSVAAAALLLSTPALAWHTITSNRGLYIGDNGVTSPATGVDMTITWNESPVFASASFKGIANGNSYDFELVGSSVSSVTSSSINGLWNITRNGALICAGCSGMAYGLDAPVNYGIKFYDSTYQFHFSAFVVTRQDY